MKIMILLLLVLCTSGASFRSQGNQKRLTKKNSRLSQIVPAAFITFERFGKAKDPDETRMLETGEPMHLSPISSGVRMNDVAWLRLHNNTRSAIVFPTNSFYSGRGTGAYRMRDGSYTFGLGEGMEISVQYEIVDADGTKIPYGADKSFISLLPPGRSVLFSVLREHLINKRSIYVPFKYEWEKADPATNVHESQHRLYFKGSDLGMVSESRRSLKR